MQQSTSFPEPPAQPTEAVTRRCPQCQRSITAIPYDLGDGPELSCPDCEWCFGVNGQRLTKEVLATVATCQECKQPVLTRLGENPPQNCSQHTP